MKRKKRFVVTKFKVVVALLILGVGAVGVAAVVLRDRGASPEKLAEAAHDYFDAGEYPEAKFVYMKLLEVEPGHQEAIARIGQIWFEQGSPFRALPFLVQATKLEPDDLECRINLARAFMSIRSPADAREQALAILERSARDSEALLMLASIASTPEEIAEVEAQLPESPAEDNADLRLARANLASAKGEADNIGELVQSAIELDPDSADAHIAMANIYFSEKKIDEAEAEFKLGSGLAPARSPARLRHVEFLVGIRKLDEAKLILEDITTKTPDLFNAWLLLASIHQTRGEHVETLAALENIFSHEPSHFSGRFMQAQSLVAEGDLPGAVDLFEKLKGAKPLGDSPVVDYNLARAYQLNGQPGQAIVALERAVGIYPGYVQARLQLANLKLESGNPGEVVAILTGLVREHPDLLEAQLLLADAYRAQGKAGEAELIFKKQIEGNPEDVQAHLFLGMTLRQQDKTDEARVAFEKARELDSENPAATYRLVELEVSAKQYPAALELAQGARERTPESAPAHHLLGMVYAASGDTERAAAAYLKAIELAPESILSYAALIDVYARAKKFDEAIVKCDEALAHRPGDVQILVQAAEIYEKIANYDKARETYKLMTTVAPDFAASYNNLAVVCSEQLGLLDEAYEAAEKARSMSPEDAAVADTLGWICFKRKDYKEARLLVGEAARKASENPIIQYHLGMVSYAVGDVDGAQRALEKATESTVDFPGKDAAAAKLKVMVTDAGTSLEGLAAKLKLSPDDVVLRIRLASAQEKAGLARDAAVNYQAIADSNPDLVVAQVALARLYAGPLDDKEGALVHARKARATAQDDHGVAVELGRIALAAGDHAWAYTLFQQSASETGDPEDLVDFAWAAYNLGKVPESIELMGRFNEKAAPNSSRSIEVAEFLALASGENSDEKAAEILARDPEHLPAQMSRSVALRRAGDLKGSELICRKILSSYPEFAPALKLLTTILTASPEALGDSDRLEEAYLLASRARQELGGDGELIRSLGIINYYREEYRTALKLLEVSGKEAKDAEILYYKGMCHLQLAESEAAREALQASLDAGLAGARADGAREAIVKLAS